MTGLTAYVGLTRIAEIKPGDVVFVSGAAGAVGSAVGQIAKALGASRVIGSAGSAEKVRHVVEDLGFDVAFNYKDGPRLEAAARGGARRHRRLLRQRRRRAPRGRDRLAATRWSHRRLRDDLGLQRHRARARAAQPVAPHPDPRPHRGLPRRRPLRPGAASTPAWRRSGSATAGSSRVRRSSTASTTRSTPSSGCCAERTPGRWSCASDVHRAKAYWRFALGISWTHRPTKLHATQRPARRWWYFPP